MDSSKKWYQSKIILLSLTAISALVANHLTGFITGHTTAAQVEAVVALDPAVGEFVKAVKGGQNWFTAAGTLVFSVVAVIRAWFTTESIA